MKKKKIYIAGKVTGLSIHEVTMKFGEAQKQIETLGYEAVNPLEVVNDFKCDWASAMRMCISALVFCDGIYFLPDWNQSKGAKLEMEIATNIGLEKYYYINDLKTN